MNRKGERMPSNGCVSQAVSRHPRSEPQPLIKSRRCQLRLSLFLSCGFLSQNKAKDRTTNDQQKPTASQKADEQRRAAAEAAKKKGRGRGRVIVRYQCHKQGEENRLEEKEKWLLQK
ncbi:hypothetical protein M9H77_16298 [Catharanthus roseus]|uniref:Uncharacterized protein n=1 Tax=Catharanthus roseus TaxID=4058 RepID=A0ACC0B1D6_CATRO|nr:hypothetical protein M9H77_16298 [Catharanthus roseus]